MYNKFYLKVKKYQNICIFRHINPDGDAYGSQFSLRNFLRMLYPNKTILALGFQDERKYTIFPENDVATDEFIKNSLAIVVDTSTVDRVDDQRFLTAKEIIKFDHHENSEEFANIDYTFSNFASCSEIIADLISKKTKLEKIDSNIAKFLYTGIITDTLSFTTSNTTEHSLLIASKLINCGIDVGQLDYLIHRKDKDLYGLISEFRSKMIVDDFLAYGYLLNNTRVKFHKSYTECKDLVKEFSTLDGVNIWVLFSESDVNPKEFNASIRSRKIKINNIAEKYGGGGHSCAAGCDHLSHEDTINLIDDLKKAYQE